MRNLAAVFLLLAVALSSLGATCHSPTRGFDFAPLRDRCRGSFRLEAGDVVRVNVWNEPNHSADQVLVRPDGKISLPLVGDVAAAGLTIVELGKLVREKLDAFVPDARVDVSLVTARSYEIYVMGEVRRTGMYTPQSQIDVLQALSLAGGFTPFAKTSQIFVISRNEKGEVRIPFDYVEAVKGRNAQQNVPLCRGDVVMVP